jgi:hypothetical protein
MSSQQPPPPAQPRPIASPVPPGGPKPIKIVQHSQLFYWWPVWVISFILGIISYFSGERLAIVSETSTIKFVDAEKLIHTSTDDKVKSEVRAALKLSDEKKKGAFVIISPDDKMDNSPALKTAVERQEKNTPAFTMHIAQNKNLGVIWAITILFVIFITNVPLRGMWSVVILVSAVLMSIIFAYAGVWEFIIDVLGGLGIFMNTGGYFFIGGALLIFWALVVFIFDQQTYWIFTPGQLRIHEAIGGGEKAFDTRGMTTEKHRDDLFRHWILGLGTGDLTVRTSGAESREFRIQNVWWVGHKLTQIQTMQRIHQEVRV